MNKPQQDPEWDKVVADIVRWAKENRRTVHTRRGQTLLTYPRRPRKSRLTGAPR